MKHTFFRIISLVLALTLIFCLFSACGKTEAPPSPTITDAKTESAESTGTEAPDADTSVPDEMTASTGSTVMPYMEFTVPDETEPLKEEAPEIEAKIKGRYNSIRRKVIIELGGKRDVPYLLSMYGKLCNTHLDGYIMSSFTDKQLRAVMDELPIYTVKGDETLLLYSNDKLVDAEKLNIRELLPEERKDEYSWGNQYAMQNLTLAEAVKKLEKGRHIAWMPVRCEGDRIESTRGEQLGREYLDFYAYFILDIE